MTGVVCQFINPPFSTNKYSKSCNYSGITGIDFFYKVGDNIERKIESQNNPSKWLTGKEKGDVPPIPMEELGKGQVNTIKARRYIGKNEKIEVCGTVVSTHKSDEGHVFINLDKSFPNQVFSATIWDDNLKNFSYKPEKELMREEVCFYGKVKEYEGKPSMYIEKESRIRFRE